VSTTACPGNQNDVSVAGNLLITSTDEPRNKAECEGNLPLRNIDDSWQGIRIFDISDKAHPRYVTAVETKCGSHTHTTIPDPSNGRVIVYVSSYGPQLTYPDCQPPHDKISVVEVPLRAPTAASPAYRAGPRRRPAAMTSPRTRRSVSPPAPAWARACSWTSATWRSRW
jgi:hypothetical protein